MTALRKQKIQKKNGVRVKSVKKTKFKYKSKSYKPASEKLIKKTLKKSRVLTKRVLRANKTSAKKVLKSSKPKAKKLTTRRAKIHKSKSIKTTRASKKLKAQKIVRAPKSYKTKQKKVPKYLLSPDLNGKLKSTKAREREIFQRAIELARPHGPKVQLKIQKETEKLFEKKMDLAHLRAKSYGLKTRRKRKNQSILESFKRAFIIFLRRLFIWFRGKKVKKHTGLSVKGKLALRYLEELYNLMLIDALDDKSLFALKLAYGNACFNVTNTSRRYNAGAGKKEDYSVHFDRFLKSINT